MSVSVTESVNIEVLKERFPSEIINPYGEVLVILSRLFQRGWESTLESQGHRVFVGDYNGEATFFVKLEKSKEKVVTYLHKRNDWTEEEKVRLVELVKAGKNWKQIGEALARSSGAVKVKFQGMQKNAGSKPATASNVPNSVVNDEDMVKELLAAASELYPKYRHACRFLLLETSKLLGGE